jgi:hypothetical protein
MKEPKRLLSHGATDFERQLLRAVANERPSAVLRSRMQRGLGLVGPLAWASNVKAMVGSVASKFAGGIGLSTIVAVAGIAAVSLTPGSDPVSAAAAPMSAVSIEAPASTVEPSVSTLGHDAPALMPAPSNEPALVAQAAVPPAPALGANEAAEAGDEPSANGAEATSGSADDGDSRLREEIALLDTARASLQHGDRESARQSLRSYRERFPDGILRREAGLLRRRADAKRTRTAER